MFTKSRILFTLLWLLCSLGASASTVTGKLVSTLGAAVTNVTITFAPKSTPIATNPSVIGSTTKGALTDVNGEFSIVLEQGNYTVTLPTKASDVFTIAVPDDTATYNWTELITSSLTYTYPTSPGYLPKSGGQMTGSIDWGSGNTNAVGLIVKSLTTAQRDALTATNGAIIYNSSTGVLNKYESGAWSVFGSGGGGSGTVTSVGLSMPASFFVVASSPVTSSGTIAVTWDTQSANRVLAGPTTGSAAAPTFRALVSADLPSHNHSASDITSGTISTDRLGSGTANSSTFLRGDNTWATPSGSGDVVGPSSATDNAVPRFDGTTGKLLQGSTVTIGDDGLLTAPGGLSAGGAGTTFSQVHVPETNAVHGFILRGHAQMGTNYVILPPTNSVTGVMWAKVINGVTNDWKILNLSSNQTVYFNGTDLVASNWPSAGGSGSSPTDTRGQLIRRGASADEAFSALTLGAFVMGDGTDPVSADPRKYIRLWDDFLSGAAAGAVGWTGAATGAGSISTDNVQSSDGDAEPGQWRLRASTTSSTGYHIRLGGTSASASQFTFGAGQVYQEWRVNVPTVGDASNDYTVRIGFQDSASADSADGVYFRYRYSENSGQWVCVAREGSSETAVNTSSTVGIGSTSWVKLGILVNAAADTVTYYVNGTSVGSVANSARIPSGTAYTLPMAHIISNAGMAANRDLFLGYYFHVITLTSSR